MLNKGIKEYVQTALISALMKSESFACWLSQHLNSKTEKKWFFLINNFSRFDSDKVKDAVAACNC